MQDFAAAHHFVMSANLHGGAKVYNYPVERMGRPGNIRTLIQHGLKQLAAVNVKSCAREQCLLFHFAL